MSASVPCCMLRYLQRPEKGVGSAATQITGSCELPSKGVGTGLGSSPRAVSCLSAERSVQPPAYWFLYSQTDLLKDEKYLDFWLPII